MHCIAVFVTIIGMVSWAELPPSSEAVPSQSSAQSPSSISKVSATSPPIPLVDLFSMEKNPGEGQLIFSRPNRSETISLGSSGFYATALVFNSKILPENFHSEINGGEVIQIALGRLAPEGKIPQFATGTVLLTQPLTHQKLLEFSLLNQKKRRNVALFLFSDPSIASQSSEEEKLKNTFFAESGQMILTPKGKSRTVSLTHQGNKLKFRLQAVTLEIAAKLSTPFNAEHASIKGTIEIPFYWPSGIAAEGLLKEIAEESLGAISPISTPAARDLTSPTRKR